MSPAQAALGLLCWPLIQVWGLGVAAVTLLLDLLATPVVALARSRATWNDEPATTRNASILVLNYDGVGFLERLLPSLEVAVARAPGDHEILVIDNGSRDGSADFVERNFPAVRVVRLPENRFFIRGNQAGVEAATRDVLVFVNNDMEVEPDFLVHLLDGLQSGDVFAVTARIEMKGDRVETGRTRATFRRGALHFVQTDGPDAADIPALWAGGGSSAFDRRKYEVLGGFEELYEPCYVEDVSLSYQAWRRGWRVVYEPRSVVHHVHRGTSSVVFTDDARTRIVCRNRELFFWRSITSPRMVGAHALWLPWNVLKQTPDNGLSNQLLALLGVLPRLPHAWLARQRARATARRSDQVTLRVANHLRRYREALGATADRPLTVLSLGVDDAPALELPEIAVVHRTVSMPAVERATWEARILGAPRRFWNAVGQGAVSDALRDAVREIDHDVVVFRDPWVLAATPADLLDGNAILSAGWGEASDTSERRFLARISQSVHCHDTGSPEPLMALCHRVAATHPR